MEGNGSADTDASLTQAENDTQPTPAITNEIERLNAENQQLRTQFSRSKPNLRVSPKGGVSVYGLGRFPVTLYKEQWLRLLAAEDGSGRSFVTMTPNCRSRRRNVDGLAFGGVVKS